MGNGRVAKFEVYVSSNSNVWGAPVAKGTLQNSSTEQLVELSSRPIGRYLRFIVLSTHDNQGYASAAEIGIIPEAEAEKPETSAAAYSTSSTSYYYLRHKSSGLFLHYLEGSTEGAFALGEVNQDNLDDNSYIFRFRKITGYTAYVNLYTLQPLKYMTVNAWRVNASDKLNTSDHAQWIQTEQTDEATICLRGAEMDGKYFNFDDQTVGSYVYSDKTSPTEVQVIKKSEIEKVVAVNDVPADQRKAGIYDLNGRRVDISKAREGVIIVDGVKRVI
ncbi:MAG: discoidin domain-containing protein, partial [Bacteroidaceae bacterium]|nr:discoidin domain-containing protein [Bacteroidaceae bacterium]